MTDKNYISTVSGKEPWIRVSKRADIKKGTALLIRAIAILSALVVAGIVIMLITGKNPFKIYGAMIDGAFGSERRIWMLLQKTAILLCISLAVTPAFKMKFWNCGAEGQALVGGLASAACMVYFGESVSLPVLFLLMFVTSVLAGCIWAVIPAIFKAKWNTNETLFTLMMNYIAMRLVSFFIKTWVKSGSGILEPMYEYSMPKLFGQTYLLNILTVAVLTAVVYIYLKYSKQGYEISVVGESENTARYIGINVKKVIIRTLIISGALCGIAGFLLVAGTNHTIAQDTVGGQGFTAIMVSWLAKFNPLYMILTSLLIIFLEVGAVQVSTQFRLDSSVSDIVIAIILFFIIGCEFFINYKLKFRHKVKEEN